VANSGGHGSSYASALDELRWSEYFDGAFQAAASQQGALQGQCVYGDGKDDVAAVQIDVHGLSNWC
jgi:transcription factor MYB, plant